MNYTNIILPVGWSISKPYRTAWVQLGKKTTHPMVRDLRNPHDDCVRALPATLTAEAMEMIQRVLANYSEPAAIYFAR